MLEGLFCWVRGKRVGVLLLQILRKVLGFPGLIAKVHKDATGSILLGLGSGQGEMFLQKLPQVLGFPGLIAKKHKDAARVLCWVLGRARVDCSSKSPLRFLGCLVSLLTRRMLQGLFCWVQGMGQMYCSSKPKASSGFWVA